MGIVPLNPVIPWAIGLAAWDHKSPVGLIFHSNAEIAQHGQGEVNISLRFHGRGHLNLAVPAQQGQSEQQTRDKLGADIARQAEYAWLQTAGKADAVRPFLTANPLFPEQLKIGLLRTLEKPPLSGQPHRPARKQGNGHQKAQG